MKKFVKNINYSGLICKDNEVTWPGYVDVAILRADKNKLYLYVLDVN